MAKQHKVIVMTGGGSGGHITPLLSVAEVLQKTAPDYKLVYVGQKNDPMVDHVQRSLLFSDVQVVRAGKLRRYHGEGLKQLLDVKTVFKNLRDVFYVAIGFVQSLLLLRKIKPSVLFCKGGYVGVPLGLAAALLKIPYVTHDSDGVPGLANKIIARWATIHAVALPKEQYTYPSHKTVTVGVPTQGHVKKVNDESQKQAREKLGIPKTAPTILVVGGGLGAAAINNAMTQIAPSLVTHESQMHILHVAGEKAYARVSQAYDTVLSDKDRRRVHVYGYTKQLALLSEAATIVITRAGATSLAEFALQGKPCIIIPHPHLTGGHQLKNAKIFADAGAALVLQEESVARLEEVVRLLLADKQKQQSLSEAITQFGNKNAAAALAGLLITTAQKSRKL